MKTKNTIIGKFWEETARRLNGDFSVKYQQINGGVQTGGLYHFRIIIPYKTTSIEIYSSLNELTLQKDEYKGSEIRITVKKDIRENIELSIWRKDFFDKIFSSGKSKTGFKEFDRIIGLKASRNIERILPRIFKNKKLRIKK